MVKTRVREYEQMDLDMERLSKEEEENLSNLREIELYLNQTIEEHQKILNRHFDLKELYTKELENLSQMSSIQRFSFRNEVSDLLFYHPEAMNHLSYFLRPLFNQELSKTYNLNIALAPQSVKRVREEQELEEEIVFDEEAWRKEQELLWKAKMQKYDDCLCLLLNKVYAAPLQNLSHSQGSMQGKEIFLSDLVKELSDEEKDRLIPSVEIFKEVMVELIKNRLIDIKSLKKEKSEFIQEESKTFQLNERLLHLVESKEEYQHLSQVTVSRIEDGTRILFENVKNEQGQSKTVRCSNVRIQII